MIDGVRVDAVLPPEMQDFVVMKKDGFPAYQLTSVVDDIHYGVDLIVRGNDLWPSTLAQHCLSYSLEAADFREIAFYHHTLLLGDSGGKLSKSSGDTSIRYLRQSGLGPAEIYSLILRKLGVEGEVGGWEELGVMLGPALL
jgi:glutamyl-tRNA synthetase